tara:strand:+ start:201 stop:563 length:363 start_codon:yes stop_codon:yes gene_type:complete
MQVSGIISICLVSTTFLLTIFLIGYLYRKRRQRNVSIISNNTMTHNPSSTPPQNNSEIPMFTLVVNSDSSVILACPENTQCSNAEHGCTQNNSDNPPTYDISNVQTIESYETANNEETFI